MPAVPPRCGEARSPSHTNAEESVMPPENVVAQGPHRQPGERPTSPPQVLHRVYRIHPGIGVSRVGNSQAADGYFVGPEVPDIDFVPPGGRYRDAGNNIRRQGTRFRIYEYTYVVQNPLWVLRPHR